MKDQLAPSIGHKLYQSDRKLSLVFMDLVEKVGRVQTARSVTLIENMVIILFPKLNSCNSRFYYQR